MARRIVVPRLQHVIRNRAVHDWPPSRPPPSRRQEGSAPRRTASAQVPGPSLGLTEFVRVCAQRESGPQVELLRRPDRDDGEVPSPHWLDGAVRPSRGEYAMGPMLPGLTGRRPTPDAWPWPGERGPRPGPTGRRPSGPSLPRLPPPARPSSGTGVSPRRSGPRPAGCEARRRCARGASGGGRGSSRAAATAGTADCLICQRVDVPLRCPVSRLDLGPGLAGR
jgi:hypothetical protein